MMLKLTVRPIYKMHIFGYIGRHIWADEIDTAHLAPRANASTAGLITASPSLQPYVVIDHLYCMSTFYYY